VTADPLSAQVHSQAHAWGVLPKHLKAASIVGRAISELQQLKAQPNEGISTMLANESKRTGKSVRELEHEFFFASSPDFDHSALFRTARGGSHGRLRLQRSCEFHDRRVAAGRRRHRHGARVNNRSALTSAQITSSRSTAGSVSV